MGQPERLRDATLPLIFWPFLPSLLERRSVIFLIPQVQWNNKVSFTLLYAVSVNSGSSSRTFGKISLVPQRRFQLGSSGIFKMINRGREFLLSTLVVRIQRHQLLCQNQSHLLFLLHKYLAAPASFPVTDRKKCRKHEDTYDPPSPKAYPQRQTEPLALPPSLSVCLPPSPSGFLLPSSFWK